MDGDAAMRLMCVENYTSGRADSRAGHSALLSYPILILPHDFKRTYETERETNIECACIGHMCAHVQQTPVYRNRGRKRRGNRGREAQWKSGKISIKLRKEAVESMGCRFATVATLLIRARLANRQDG